jgi:hypothetical protein
MQEIHSAHDFEITFAQCPDDFLLWQFDLCVQGYGSLSERLVRASLLHNGVLVSDILWSMQLNRFPVQPQRGDNYDYLRLDFGQNDVLLPLKRSNDVITVRLTFNSKIGRCYWLRAYTTQLPETQITQRYEVQFHGIQGRTLFITSEGQRLLCGNPLAPQWMPLLTGPPTQQQQRNNDRRHAPPPMQPYAKPPPPEVNAQSLEHLKQMLVARMKPTKTEMETPYSP